MASYIYMQKLNEISEVIFSLLQADIKSKILENIKIYLLETN